MAAAPAARPYGQNKITMKRALRIAKIAIAAGAVLSLLAIAAAEIAVERIARGQLFDRAEEVPVGRAALVLGTSQSLRDGSPNPYFDNRIRAAAELWRTGRITAIVVSGDNGRTTYNEPEAMRDALVACGVPAGAIRLDHAGFRTLDSVVRMHEIFGQRAFVVVSQEFHNRRAVVLARAYGLDAAGFNADGVRTGGMIRVWLRERLARVKLFLDLAFGKRPKFLGERIELKPYGHE